MFPDIPAATEMQKESAATCRPDNAELHELLEFLHDRYNCTAFVADDPVAIPHDYTSREDIEISGFLAATIAWGKRPMIVTNGRRLMERMDRAPYDFVLNASERELGALAGFVHRTFNDGDCIDFIRALRPFYAHSGSAHHPAGISLTCTLSHRIARRTRDGRCGRHTTIATNGTPFGTRRLFRTGIRCLRRYADRFIALSYGVLAERTPHPCRKTPGFDRPRCEL